MPLRTPVAALKVTLPGRTSLPVSLRVGTGKPGAVSVKPPAVPTAKVALGVLVNTEGWPTNMAAENADVSFVAVLVAVAVANSPGVTATGREAVKLAWPVPAVVT